METGVGAKPARDERAGRRFRIAHEMTDMVEENLVGDGKLAVCLGLCAFHSRTFSPSISLCLRRTFARSHIVHASTSKHREVA
mgnify:CR=1 FL=1